MTRLLLRRLERLEHAFQRANPGIGTPVFIGRYLWGTPEALADEEAWRVQHPGRCITVRIVDGRKAS